MSSKSQLDVGLGLEETHVIITGAAGQIGQVIVQAFLSAGANVTALDINAGRMQLKHEKLLWIQVDVTDEEKMQQAFEQARAKFGIVAVCCAAAGLDLSFIPHHGSICDLPLAQWQRTMEVNTTGTFLTARSWLRGIRDQADPSTRNVSMIIVGSEAGVFGVPGNSDYASSKAAIQYGLVRSLAPDAVNVFSRARVNAVAPGPVDTPQFRKECQDNPQARYQEFGATTALKSAIPMEIVAKICLMLGSDNYSSHITGQVIPIDGGKSGIMLWNKDGSSKW